MNIKLPVVRCQLSDVSFFCLLFSVSCFLHFTAGCEETSNKLTLAEEFNLLKP